MNDAAEKAREDLRALVGKWDADPFKAVAEDGARWRGIVRDCLKLADALAAERDALQREKVEWLAANDKLTRFTGNIIERLMVHRFAIPEEWIDSPRYIVQSLIDLECARLRDGFTSLARGWRSEAMNITSSWNSPSGTSDLSKKWVLTACADKLDAVLDQARQQGKKDG